VLIRPKLFLTIAAICVSPLLVLSLLNFRGALGNTKAILRDNLEDELIDMTRSVQTVALEREHELTALASGPLPDYVHSARSREDMALIARVGGSATSGAAAGPANVAREAITKLSANFAHLACFDASKQLMFLFQSPNYGSPLMSLPQAPDYISPNFRTKDFLPGAIEPDGRVWTAKNDTPLCSIVSHPTLGDVRRCSVPIFLTPDHDSASARGALVADIRLDRLFEQMDVGLGFSTEQLRLRRRLLVLDSSGKIVYHPNAAVRNQPVNSAMPEIAQISASMVATGTGTAEYRSPEGETWIASYQPILSGLSLVLARNYSLASQSARPRGWFGIALSILFGMAGAILFTKVYQRKTESLDRVTESVAAIAKGNLDRDVLLPSSDEMRSLADGVNQMTERLREQLAREGEARQFESFIKLSAFLTHDLKNAIEGLSLMVGNMERHFHNPKFRADAMRALTAATDRLRHLVVRISNPVNTLSGEFKMPRPTDLIPLLRRVLEQMAEPLRETHEIELRLPSSLMAMVDGERIEKVMENLVLNGIEAMGARGGKLTVEAGPVDGDNVFFSVSDTGVGMNPDFIRRELFHPFTTTKTRGVGLGLYTCREVVRANGGSIEVESKVGFGTTFRVVLASAQIKTRD
jgi:signal transduction histidine kinase